MQHDKSPEPNGWTVEFFEAFMEFFDKDILTVVEEMRVKGRILSSFNSNFIALIHKKDKGITFDDYKPISYWKIYCQAYQGNSIKPVSQE